MSKPVYYYFNLRARGELSRLVAAVGKIDYEDKRLSFSEWPGQYKSKTPYGQVPALEVDGHWYAQKLAITLFFARKAGLYPTSGNPLEILKYDHVLNFTEEILEQIVQAVVDKTLYSKPEKFDKLKQDVLDAKIPILEKLLTQNGKGYFVEDKLSVVDLSAFNITEHIVDTQGKSYLDSYPQLKAHFDRVGENENLKKYLANRPAGDANL
uniref:Glutathione transferase n=1 Tax=Arion vulgaris TaxID=1028688 RepID=A0A0B6ZCN5_9EUPU